MTLMRLDEIQVDTRYRKELGDIAELAASMASLGLLQPVVLRADNLLIAGERRIAAARSLGWTEIDVFKIDGFEDATELLRAERDENTCRKQMTITELVAIGKRLEELERPKATQRSLANLNQGTERPTPTGDATGDHDRYVRTAELVGKAIGVSGRQYERARHVVDSVNDPDPSIAKVAREAVADMDATGNVRPAYDKVKAARNTLPGAPKFGPRRKHRQVIESLTTALTGWQIAVAEINKLDESVTGEEAALFASDLSKALRAIGRLNHLLKERSNDDSNKPQDRVAG